MRFGSTNRAASPEWLRAIQKNKEGGSYDQSPLPDLDISALDMPKIQELFAKTHHVHRHTMNEQKLIGLGILLPLNHRTVCSQGGMLLFGKQELRERYVPNAILRCACFSGTTKNVFLDQAEFSSVLPELLPKAMEFIQRNTRKGAIIEGFTRQEKPEYSPVILREILTNAVIHADYSLVGMHLRISLFSDRIEVESPGGLPLGYTIEDFYAGISHIRNRVLVRTFRELDLIEQWGTGYKRICETCVTHHYPLPKWEEIGMTLRVTLYPQDLATLLQKQAQKQTQLATLATSQAEDSPQVPLAISARQIRIVSLLKEYPSLTSKKIHHLLQLESSERTLRGDLVYLRKQGWLVMEGAGRSVTWALSPSARQKL